MTLQPVPSRIMLWIATIGILLLSPDLAHGQRSTAPWQLLGSGYNSAIRMGQWLSYPPANDICTFELEGNAAAFMSADNGGVSRSAEPSGACGPVSRGSRPPTSAPARSQRPALVLDDL